MEKISTTSRFFGFVFCFFFLVCLFVFVLNYWKYNSESPGPAAPTLATAAAIFIATFKLTQYLLFHFIFERKKKSFKSLSSSVSQSYTFTFHRVQTLFDCQVHLLHEASSDAAGPLASALASRCLRLRNLLWGLTAFSLGILTHTFYIRNSVSLIAWT